MEIPRRYSLATQAAASIRENIENSTWTDVLPSERTLCLLLQISRPTLRGALAILCHEGLVEIRSRQSTKILKIAARLQNTRRTTVVLLTGRSLHEHGATTLSFVGKLQVALTSSDFQLVIVDDHQLNKAHPQKLLKKIAARYSAVCYLLLTVSEPVQMFFSRLSMPAMVCGSRFPGVRLPSCDWNYPAIGRHAAGILLGLGHQRLSLVRPSVLRKGDLQGEQGFAEVTKKHLHATLTTIHNNGRAASLHRTILKTFAREEPPTGVLVLNPYDCITVLFALETMRLKVPEAISIISLDWGTVFDALPFRVASYSDRSKLVEKSTKLVLKLVLNRFVPPHENLIMADFHPGDTVGTFQKDPMRFT